MRQKTMRDALRALINELGETDGKSVFEWYCKTYGLTVADDCPGVILWEIFGE